MPGNYHIATGTVLKRKINKFFFFKKEKLLKVTRKKQQVTYKGTLIRITDDFTAETPLKARREWEDIFEVKRRRNLDPRILYPGKLSFGFNGIVKL